MKNIYIYCEGQTEETFVNEILTPYLSNIMIFTTPIICTKKSLMNKRLRKLEK